MKELVARKLVVVGNGMVGHRLVQAMRDRDAAGTWRITVLGEETRPAYDRVALSSYVDGRSAEGRIRPAIGATYPLERAADAHTALAERATVGKSLLLP